jgi:multidrug efflux system outer membrane protein
MKKLTALLIAVLFLCACTMGKDYQKPDLDEPENLPPEDISMFTKEKWWTVFDDEVLNKMVETALENNQDLVKAIARVDEARAQLGIATSDQMPTVDVTASGSRGGTDTNTDNAFSAGLGISYEIDLWGKYRRLSESARATLLSTEAQKDTVRLTLTSDVSRSYFALRALDAQLALARHTLDTRNETVRIYESRKKAGYSSDLDLTRVQAERETVQANIYKLEQDLAKAETSLSVLLGQSPAEMVNRNIERGKELEKITVIPNIPANVPSDLLLRRPDVRAAEGQLIAANADVGAAKAAFFPSISLTGLLGTVSPQLSELFGGSSNIWQAGGDLFAPIFQGGKLKSMKKQAEARYRQMLADYTKTAQLAYKETLDALTDNKQTRLSVESYTQKVEALDKSYSLSKKQKDAGLVGLLDVLDSERNLYSAQMDLITARQNQLDAIVDVCKALGGGWTQQ